MKTLESVTTNTSDTFKKVKIESELHGNMQSDRSEVDHRQFKIGHKSNRLIGWYGVYEFGLVDTDAHWIVTSASTVGANT